MFLYLLTGPDQGPIPGLFVSGIGSLTDRLATLHEGWTTETVRSALEELRGAGILRTNARPPLFWMPNAIKHRDPPNPNQVVNWRRYWCELPECTMRDEAMLHIREHLPPPSAARFDELFPELRGGRNPSGNPSRNPCRNSEKGKVRREVPPEPAEEMRLARLLREGIRAHLPEYANNRVKDRHVATWAADIEKLMRLDGYSAADVEALIRAVHHDGALPFWRPNLLSGKKLREKFPQVLGQLRDRGVVSKPDGRPWHIRNSAPLRRLRDRLRQQSQPITAGALMSSVPAPNTPNAAEAADAVRWLEKR